MAIMGNYHTRLGDLQISLGMERYQGSDDKQLWMLTVSRHPTSEIILSGIADMAALLAIATSPHK